MGIRESFRERFQKMAENYYMGKDKERKNFFVKLIKVQSSIKYGKVYVVKDKQDRMGLFFNYVTTDDVRIPNIDDCILIRATCNHSENTRDKIPQTYFNRVQILKNVGSIEQSL